jgi:hypothetical protein
MALSSIISTSTTAIVRHKFAITGILSIQTKYFPNLECVELSNESISLLVTKSVGPRIISLRFNQGNNLFTELPEREIECPGSGILRLWGGHRLWYTSEDPPRTYLPDDNPVHVSEVPSGVRVIQPSEPQTGIQKSLNVTLPDLEPLVVIDHGLENCCRESVELAPRENVAHREIWKVYRVEGNEPEELSVRKIVNHLA